MYKASIRTLRNGFPFLRAVSLGTSKSVALLKSWPDIRWVDERQGKGMVASVPSGWGRSVHSLGVVCLNKAMCMDAISYRSGAKPPLTFRAVLTQGGASGKLKLERMWLAPSYTYPPGGHEMDAAIQTYRGPDCAGETVELVFFMVVEGSAPNSLRNSTL